MEADEHYCDPVYNQSNAIWMEEILLLHTRGYKIS